MAHRSLACAACGALLTLAPLLQAQTPAGGGSQTRQRYFDLYYTLGYRFVDVHGSRDRYESDYDLDDGFRASEIRIDGTPVSPYGRRKQTGLFKW